MTTTAHLYRTLHVLTLCVLLIAPPTWAQHVYPDTDAGTTSSEFDNDPDDHGQQYEQELFDIEQQYSGLVPESAKSTTAREGTKDVESDNEENEELEEQQTSLSRKGSKGVRTRVKRW